MKRIWILLGVFVTLLGVCIATYGQTVDTTDVICAFNKKVPGVMETFDVPFGAQHKKEIIWRKEVPDGFRTVLALIQVASVVPCDFQSGQEARLSLRAIRLIERNPKTGTETVITEVTDFRQGSGRFRFEGKLYPRIPKWYDGKASEPADGMLTRDASVLSLDLSVSPRTLYHGWTEPQVEAKPGMNYLVEAEIQIIGLARLQIGIDYWRFAGAEDKGWKKDCQETNHCEGHLSQWFGPTTEGNWQTVRTPAALLGK